MYLPTHKGTHILLCSIQRKKQRKQQQHSLSKQVQFAVEHIAPLWITFLLFVKYYFTVAVVYFFTPESSKKKKKKRFCLPRKTFWFDAFALCVIAVRSCLTMSSAQSQLQVSCIKPLRIWQRLNAIWPVQWVFFSFWRRSSVWARPWILLKQNQMHLSVVYNLCYSPSGILQPLPLLLQSTGCEVFKGIVCNICTDLRLLCVGKSLSNIFMVSIYDNYYIMTVLSRKCP